VRRRKQNAVGSWTARDDVLLHTCRIAATVASGNGLERIPEILTSFPPSLGPDERLWASAPYIACEFRALGDGSWQTSSMLVAGTGTLGVSLAVGSLVAGAISRSKARDRAAADAVPRWVPAHQGQLFVGRYGFYFHTPQISPGAGAISTRPRSPRQGRRGSVGSPRAVRRCGQSRATGPSSSSCSGRSRATPGIRNSSTANGCRPAGWSTPRRSSTPHRSRPTGDCSPSPAAGREATQTGRSPKHTNRTVDRGGLSRSADPEDPLTGRRRPAGGPRADRREPWPRKALTVGASRGPARPSPSARAVARLGTHRPREPWPG